MSQPSTPSGSTPNNPQGVPATGNSNTVAGSTGNAILKRVISARESSVVIVLAILCLFLWFAPQLGQLPFLKERVDWSGVREQFFGQRNLQNLSLQIALLSVFAIGETVVIITSGIDLSLGSLIAFSGMALAAVATKLDAIPATHSAAIILAIIAALLVGLTIGTIHATLIQRLKLPPFVVTLGALTILRSQSLLMNRQLPISISQFNFLIYLANGRFPSTGSIQIPIPVWIVGFIALTVHLLLSKSSIGRYVYSIGSNEQATRLSGVNIGRVKLFAYGLSSLLGAVAGILYAGYGGQGDPLSGTGYELNAVAAAVIGGANLAGGQGTIVGTLLGACLLNVILSGINFTLTNPSLWEGTVVGGVLLLAVLTSALQQRGKARH